ncbi:hypothetical protein Tco_0488578 [Tanacetum coccineum]
MMVEPFDETELEDLGLNTCNHEIPLSSKKVPSFDVLKPQPQPLRNCPSLDVSLGDERGPEPPIKPISPDSFRMKVVDLLSIHTPPSPHLAYIHPKDTYCYYHPCIDDPKKHYGFKQVIFDEKKIGKRGDDVASIKRRRRDFQSDGVEDFVTASERSSLKVDLEPSMWRRPLFDQLLGEIRAFSHHENETLTDAWLHMKEMLRNCHVHNLSKGNIIKIFYHGLCEINQEVLNATVGGIFLYKTPNQAYQLLEDKVLLKLDWAKNQKTKSSLKKTISFTDKGSSNSDTDKIMARMDAMTMKMDAQYKEFQSRSKQPNPDHNDDDTNHDN